MPVNLLESSVCGGSDFSLRDVRRWTRLSTMVSLSSAESFDWLVPSSGSSPFLGSGPSAILAFGSGLVVGLARIQWDLRN